MKMHEYANHSMMTVIIWNLQLYFLCYNNVFINQFPGLSFDFSYRAIYTHSFIQPLFSIYHVSRRVMVSGDTKTDHAVKNHCHDERKIERLEERKGQEREKGEG